MSTESEDFEAWWSAVGDEVDYSHGWKVWQARAALPAPALPVQTVWWVSNKAYRVMFTSEALAKEFASKFSADAGFAITKEVMCTPMSSIAASAPVSKFFLYALERAITTLRGISDRARTVEDPYAGLWWADDADSLEEGLEALSAIVGIETPTHDAQKT